MREIIIIIITSLILSLDSTEFKYLHMLLSEMGFGGNFLRALGSPYACPCVHIKINNMCAESFQLACETQHGCPLSPLLFALAVEPLAQSICNKALIKGQKSYKLSLFADDVVMFLTDPMNSLCETQKVLHCFALVAGPYVNTAKLEIYLIKVSAHIKATIKSCFEYKWVNKGWKYLGIIIPMQ